MYLKGENEGWFGMKRKEEGWEGRLGLPASICFRRSKFSLLLLYKSY